MDAVLILKIILYMNEQLLNFANTILYIKIVILVMGIARLMKHKLIILVYEKAKSFAHRDYYCLIFIMLLKFKI